MDHHYEELRRFLGPFIAKDVIEIIREFDQHQNAGLKNGKENSRMDGETVIETLPDHGLIALSLGCL